MSYTLTVIQALCYGMYVLSIGFLIISGVGYCNCVRWDNSGQRRWRVIALVAAIVLVCSGAVHAVIVHLP